MNTQVDIQQPMETNGWLSRMSEYFQLSAILRIIGMGVTVTATTMFLFQNWDAGDDLYRYGLVFAQGVLLSLLGLATNRWLRERKSARLFLGLSLVTATAAFTILGALIYSRLQWDGSGIHYPDHALWLAQSMPTLLGVLTGSLLILIPLTWLGFAVLSRSSARELTLLFTLNAGLLLIPLRMPALTALLAASAVLFSIRLLRGLREKHATMRTREGLIAGLIVAIPLMVMIGRGAYLYASNELAAASLGLLGYVTLRLIGKATTDSPSIQRMATILSLPVALITAMATVSLLDQWWLDLDQWALILVGLITSAALFDLSRWGMEKDAPRFRLASIQVLLFSGLVETLLWPGMLTSALSALISAPVLYYAFISGRRITLLAALLTLLGSLTHLVITAIDGLELGGWLGFALLGMATILFAAVLERHGETIKAMIATPGKLEP